MIKEIDFSDLTVCQRLFHGRGHAYPTLEHVNIDWFSPVVLITLYQEVESPWLAQLVKELAAKISACKSIVVQYRCRKFSPSETLFGEEINSTQVTELGLSYQVTFGQAQNSGLFLDMRNGRQWVKDNAQGKNVLNLFSYTCAFSVAALAGGAKQVVNVDLSKASLSRGRENHRLNLQDLSKVKFEGVDIFKSYGRLKKHGPYDLLICDPPSFQKGSVNIQRDYGKIIRRIPQLMKPSGQLMLCLNSPDLDDKFLLAEVEKECPSCQFEQSIAPPEVFKEAHLGKGLKVLLFTYKGE